MTGSGEGRAVLVVDANVWVSAQDPRDPERGRSAEFLRASAATGAELVAPEYLILEVGCAVARRSGSPDAGARTVRSLRRSPFLRLVPLSGGLLAAALDLGLRTGLRSGDALYAAAARLEDLPLITWDEELVKRFPGALTPREWLAGR